MQVRAGARRTGQRWGSMGGGIAAPDYVGDALALRARLVQRLDELRRRLKTYRTFDDPGAGETADRIAAVALAIEELDALVREDAEAAASG